MNIPDIVLKIKTKQEICLKWAISLGILILIGFTGFFIGKIVSRKPSKTSEPIQVVYPPQIPTSSEAYKAKVNTPRPTPEKADQHPAVIKTKTNWLYAGSKTGKTYYTKDCRGINRVKPENRVYFTTRAEATQAGYTLSKTCHESI